MEMCAMCALGSMTTYNLISKILKDKAVRTGADISKTVNDSFKKLNILLMKCNARQIFTILNSLVLPFY